MTYAPKIQGDFALNQIVVHLALVTRSIAGPGNQATFMYYVVPAMTRNLGLNGFIWHTSELGRGLHR